METNIGVFDRKPELDNNKIVKLEEFIANNNSCIFIFT
jgi:hypothetical protein